MTKFDNPENADTVTVVRVCCVWVHWMVGVLCLPSGYTQSVEIIHYGLLNTPPLELFSSVIINALSLYKYVRIRIHSHTTVHMYWTTPIDCLIFVLPLVHPLPPQQHNVLAQMYAPRYALVILANFGAKRYKTPIDILFRILAARSFKQLIALGTHMHTQMHPLAALAKWFPCNWFGGSIVFNIRKLQRTFSTVFNAFILITSQLRSVLLHLKAL